MIRALIAAATLLAVTPGQTTEWILLTEHLSHATYVDPESLRFSEDMTKVQVWEMDDYKEPSLFSHDYRSARILKEYDCSENMYRILYLILYTGRMGGGEGQDEAATDGEWKRIVPGSVGASKHEKYCALMEFMAHSGIAA